MNHFAHIRRLTSALALVSLASATMGCFDWPFGYNTRGYLGRVTVVYSAEACLFDCTGVDEPMAVGTNEKVRITSVDGTNLQGLTVEGTPDVFTARRDDSYGSSDPTVMHVSVNAVGYGEGALTLYSDGEIYDFTTLSVAPAASVQVSLGYRVLEESIELDIGESREITTDVFTELGQPMRSYGAVSLSTTDPDVAYLGEPEWAAGPGFVTSSAGKTTLVVEVDRIRREIEVVVRP